MTFELLLKGYDKGVEGIALFTPDVIERVKCEYPQELRKILNKSNIEIGVIDGKLDPIAFFIVEEAVIFGFFNDDEMWDDKDLIGLDNDAIMWARELFKYYRANSTIVKDI